MCNCALKSFLFFDTIFAWYSYLTWALDAAKYSLRSLWKKHKIAQCLIGNSAAAVPIRLPHFPPSKQKLQTAPPPLSHTRFERHRGWTVTLGNREELASSSKIVSWRSNGVKSYHRLACLFWLFVDDIPCFAYKESNALSENITFVCFLAAQLHWMEISLIRCASFYAHFHPKFSLKTLGSPLTFQTQFCWFEQIFVHNTRL